MTTFHTPEPVRLRVELWEGSVHVLAEETDTTTVELEPDDNGAAQELIERATVEQRGNDLVVLLPKARGGLFRRGLGVQATIHVPLSSSAYIETASADVELVGVLGDVRVSTGSGDIEIEHADDVTVRTGSGDLNLGTADGNCSVKSGSADIVIGLVAGNCDLLSGSGDVEIDSVGGRLAVKTGSGDVAVRSGGGDVDAMAGSGDVALHRVSSGRVKAKTGSGDIAIGVASGTSAYLDVMTVSGDVHSELDGADSPRDGELTVEISVMSGSGDVVLQRA